MLAPAPGASRTLLFTPDHLGSAVPVLLAWLAAERLPARRRGPGWARCYVRPWWPCCWPGARSPTA